VAVTRFFILSSLSPFLVLLLGVGDVVFVSSVVFGSCAVQYYTLEPGKSPHTHTRFSRYQKRKRENTRNYFFSSFIDYLKII
jgi:hypothetical protein